MRRARGTLLRLVRRRRVSALVGAILAFPALWLEMSSADVPWWVQGLSLVAGATGVALLWAGVTGVSRDWVE